MSLDRLTVPVVTLIGAVIFAVSLSWSLSSRIASIEHKLAAIEEQMVTARELSQLRIDLCKAGYCP
jgi:hypothetical protein